MPFKRKQKLYQKHVAYKLNYVHLHCMQLLHLAHGRIQVEGYQPATLTRWILMGSMRSCAFIISDRNPTFLGFSLTPHKFFATFKDSEIFIHGTIRFSTVKLRKHQKIYKMLSWQLFNGFYTRLYLNLSNCKKNSGDEICWNTFMSST